MFDWAKVSKSNNAYTFDFRINQEISISALEAAQHTIKHIVNNYPAPYTLYLSGGIDSQAMLYSWILSGQKFSTFAGVYNQDCNLNDLETLKLFAKQYNVAINFVDVDVIKFLKEEHDYYARTYKCGSPHITTYMKMLGMTKIGTRIMSGNFINQGMHDIDRNQLGLYHYGIISKQSIIPFFFLETKELAYSFVLPKMSTKRVKDLRPEEKFYAYDFRLQTYHLNGFPVIKQNNKHTGFEKIKEHFDNEPIEFHPKLRLQRTEQQLSRRKFDLLFRNKYEVLMLEYKYTILSSSGKLKYV